MKKYAFFFLAVSTFNVFAQSLDRDIQTKIDRLGQLAGRGEVSRLSFTEKQDLDRSLRSALITLRDNDDRRPAPMPMPNHSRDDRRDGPSMGTMRMTALVSDLTDNIGLLNLRGNNPGDILSQCVAQLPSLRLSTMTKIVMTANNHRYVTSSIFTANSVDVCTKIVNQMQPGRNDRDFVDVSGTVMDLQGQSLSLNLSGDRSDVLESCVRQTAGNRLSTVTKFVVSVNRSALIQKSVFKGPSLICSMLTEIINEQIP